ncbi:type IV secretory system conjugative DNA transfer family protein [Rhodopseudomonas pseudopalustris]|uniref:Type IV secretion system protein VirD4 n=1 Tax=Rhodopseudomonas pseudopalustris TaxID=1513892 RepID=A0A1H8LUH2_9BRAD|nr:type IV secretory system conjugative DNA transfer family protein [Rhodopseudomonas pseudopalustris]SEO08526.1 type IV secretion system protein VirD4 [Rhodopseudomonas pseudopalustris]
MLRNLQNGLVIGGTFVALILFGYPLAATGQHGFNSALWPTGVVHWWQWYGYVVSFNWPEILDRYGQMLRNVSNDFAWGGRVILGFTAAPFAIAATWLIKGKDFGLVRDLSGVFGAARWANAAELGLMKSGLELGTDKSTGRAVRVSVEGNLLTIAAPRKGKSAGLLIPNLVYPELDAWAGPAVVIDPKGAVFLSVSKRRRELGRTVRCVDPVNLVGGTDCWNPFEHLDPNDILYLQLTAQALLPESVGANDNTGYFRSRAVDLLVGAMLVAHQSNEPGLPEVLRLLSEEPAIFVEGLNKLSSQPAARIALGIMMDDPKTRDPIKSTTAQALSWLADERLRNLVSSSSFDLTDLMSGDVDLFIAVPTDYNETLAPLFRWLLADIFNTIRRNRLAERLVIFVDEAAALKRFDAILKASGELPGYGASLWTFWQTRQQMVDTYGESGAATLLGTAEIVTISDVPASDPDESERWSRALGDFTVLVETKTVAKKGDKPSISTASQAARLMTKEELTTNSESEVIVFPNSRYYARHPIRLRKTDVLTDKRFLGIIDGVKPVGRL